MAPNWEWLMGFWFDYIFFIYSDNHMYLQSAEVSNQTIRIRSFRRFSSSATIFLAKTFIADSRTRCGWSYWLDNCTFRADCFYLQMIWWKLYQFKFMDNSFCLFWECSRQVFSYYLGMCFENLRKFRNSWAKPDLQLDACFDPNCGLSWNLYYRHWVYFYVQNIANKLVKHIFMKY